MKLTVIESPFAGNVERNLAYVRAAMADCIRKNEAPFASHSLYTQPGVLRDELPHERALGIAAGFAWGTKADLRVFYVDLGWSRGMREALTKYRAEGLAYTFRVLGDPWSWLMAPLGPDGEECVVRQARRELTGLRAYLKTRASLATTFDSLRFGDTEDWRALKEKSARETILPPPPHHNED